MKTIRFASTILAIALLAGAAAPTSAQIQDARWLPFVGCWEPVGEDTEDAGLLCFGPSERGVAMTSLAGAEIVATELLVADGQPRPISAEGCEGTERVSFSEDGARVFTESEIVCAGDARPGTGVMALVSPTRWVDVRALRIQGETVSWVQEYRMVGRDRLAEEGISDPMAGLEGAIRSARIAAARDLSVADVEEAVRRMNDQAVVAWLVAERDVFELSGGELVRLAEAGVPEGVIDAMVAVSYPDRFVVAPEAAVVRADDEFAEGRRIPMRVGYRSYLGWDPFYYGYSPFGYSRFGYGYGFGWGYGYGVPYRYGPYGYGPTILRIERRPSGGRAVNGRGWTRSSASGRSGGAVRRGGSSSSGGYIGSSSSGGSRGAASGGRRARPRGGSGGDSVGSASSGSSGSAARSSGRRARPRGG